MRRGPGRDALWNYTGAGRFLTGSQLAGWQKNDELRFTLKLFINRQLFKEINMPIIAWLLGVPISVILLLMLFGVF